MEMGGVVGWALSHHPVLVGLTTFLLSWGLISLLMWWPEGRFRRKKYLNFTVGDSPIGLPLMLAGMAGMLRDYDGSNQFWGHDWWQPAMAGISASIVGVMFVMERITGQYTPQEQRTPSKVAHNLVLFAGLTIVLTALMPTLSTLDDSIGRYDVCFVVGAGVWLGAFLYDTFFGEYLEGAHMTRQMWENRVEHTSCPSKG